MEGDRRQFESQAAEDEHQGHDAPRRGESGKLSGNGGVVGGREDRANRPQLGRARQAIHQGQPIQQRSRREDAEQEVLDGRFLRAGIAPPEVQQHVGGNADQLERQEQHNEVVGDDRGEQSREQQHEQPVELSQGGVVLVRQGHRLQDDQGRQRQAGQLETDRQCRGLHGEVARLGGDRRRGSRPEQQGDEGQHHQCRRGEQPTRDGECSGQHKQRSSRSQHHLRPENRKGFRHGTGSIGRGNGGGGWPRQRGGLGGRGGGCRLAGQLGLRFGLSQNRHNRLQ